MGFKPDQELKKFLAEDLGKGDITSKLLERKQITAKIITRQDTIVSGASFAKQIFSLKKVSNPCLSQKYLNDFTDHFGLTKNINEFEY